MRKHHPKNERMKRRYLAYLEEAKRMSTKSTDQVAAAIAQFEVSTDHRDFARFHVEHARRFKRQLGEQTNPKTGKPLAKATIRSRLLALKSFFQWLADQPGYRKGIRYADAEYFNPSANDSRIATARRERPVPTLDEVRRVLAGMDTVTAIEKRDRALIAFAILTGIRDDAMASLSLRHVDLARRTVFQDARSVRTKNRKTMTTWFFPVGDDIEAIVTEWISYLKAEQAFGPDDPLFPQTHIERNAEGLFAPVGLARAHWANADAIRRIFRQVFESAGLGYRNPHSLRKTLARLRAAHGPGRVPPINRSCAFRLPGPACRAARTLSRRRARLCCRRHQKAVRPRRGRPPPDRARPARAPPAAPGNWSARRSAAFPSPAHRPDR